LRLNFTRTGSFDTATGRLIDDARHPRWGKRRNRVGVRRRP
jgi:hypothetical protein